MITGTEPTYITCRKFRRLVLIDRLRVLVSSTPLGKWEKDFSPSFLYFFFLYVHVWNPSFLMLSFYCSQRISKYYQPLSFILSHLDTGDFSEPNGWDFILHFFSILCALKKKKTSNQQTKRIRIHHLPYHLLVTALSPRTAQHMDGCLRCGQSCGFAWCLADPTPLVSCFLILPETKGPIVWEVWVWSVPNSHPNFESD